MLIFAIESSCDETAAAVIENGTKILSNVVASSAAQHSLTGGIIPENAARQQIRSIIPVIDEAMGQAGVTHKDIDAIAVTIGPGLIGSLLVGVETAKTLSLAWNKPIIPVNHMLAHIYANWLGEKVPEFPALALVVSGGHTDLVLLKGHPSGGKDNLTYLGGTRDDAAGEAFDKSARLLGLPYPGGPSIAAAAAKFKISNLKFKISLPRPMLDENNYDWSFSGLKTAVLREVQTSKDIKLATTEIAHEVQEAIVECLVTKTLKACQSLKPKSLLLAGGVSANARLREAFGLKIENCKLKIDLFVPEARLCTDNAASIGSCAFFNNTPTPWRDVCANPELTITG